MVRVNSPRNQPLSEDIPSSRPCKHAPNVPTVTNPRSKPNAKIRKALKKKYECHSTATRPNLTRCCQKLIFAHRARNPCGQCKYQ